MATVRMVSGAALIAMVALSLLVVVEELLRTAYIERNCFLVIVAVFVLLVDIFLVSSYI